MTDLSALAKSKNFCILPWLHVHVLANGDAFPCCVSTDREPVGNFNDHKNLNHLVNSPKMRELRLRMLNNEPSAGCSKCQFSANNNPVSSFRTDINEVFAKHLPQVALTKTDGALEEFKMAYFDTRFSNLCNMKCRTCSPTFSSSWHEDSQKIHGPSKTQKVISLDSEKSDAYWRAIEPHLNEVEFVNFAGGEPFLMPENMKMLEHWIENKKTNILIRYTTNFSHIHANPKIFELWKHFSDIKINASLDATGARAEYLRKGTQWSRIVENVHALKEKAPHVKLEVSSTVSAFNAWHIPDFHEEWITQGLVGPNDLHLNLLSNPSHMSAQILPINLKKKISAKYISALQKIKNHNLKSERLEKEYRKFIEFMNAHEANEQMPQFLIDVEQVDRLRNENIFSTYPELLELNSNVP